MSDETSDKPKGQSATIIAFPNPRAQTKSENREFHNLGEGKMAVTLGAAKEQQTGHWCSRCQGIWFGYLLEVECPKCGNRQG